MKDISKYIYCIFLSASNISNYKACPWIHGGAVPRSNTSGICGRSNPTTRIFLRWCVRSTHLQTVHCRYHHDKVIRKEATASVQLSLPPAFIFCFLQMEIKESHSKLKPASVLWDVKWPKPEVTRWSNLIWWPCYQFLTEAISKLFL